MRNSLLLLVAIGWFGYRFSLVEKRITLTVIGIATALFILFIHSITLSVLLALITAYCFSLISILSWYNDIEKLDME